MYSTFKSYQFYIQFFTSYIIYTSFPPRPRTTFRSIYFTRHLLENNISLNTVRSPPSSPISGPPLDPRLNSGRLSHSMCCGENAYFGFWILFFRTFYADIFIDLYEMWYKYYMKVTMEYCIVVRLTSLWKMSSLYDVGK